MLGEISTGTGHSPWNARGVYAGYPSVGAMTVTMVEAVLSSGVYSHPRLRGVTLAITNVTDVPLNDPTVNCAVPLPPVVTTRRPIVLPLHVTATEARSDPSTVAPSEIDTSTSHPPPLPDAFPENPSTNRAGSVATGVVVDDGGIDVVVVVVDGTDDVVVVVDGGGVVVVADVVDVVDAMIATVVVDVVFTDVVDDASGVEVEVEVVPIPVVVVLGGVVPIEVGGRVVVTPAPKDSVSSCVGGMNAPVAV
jgi:hypothetical protein